MDTFENVSVLVELIECPKFGSSRPKFLILLEETKLLLISYVRWLSGLVNANFTVPTQSEPLGNKVVSLLQVFSTKHEQAIAQTKRVREAEDEMVEELQSLSNIIGEFVNEYGNQSPEFIDEAEPIEDPK